MPKRVVACRYDGCQASFDPRSRTKHENTAHYRCTSCTRTFLPRQKDSHQKDDVNRRFEVLVLDKQASDEQSANLLASPTACIRAPGAPRASPLQQIIAKYRIDPAQTPIIDFIQSADLQSHSGSSEERLELFGKSRYDLPQISRLQHWRADMSMSTVAEYVLADMFTHGAASTEVWRNGELSSDPLSAAQVMLQLQLQSEACQRTQAYLTNVKAPSLESFSVLPQALDDVFYIEHKTLTSANITPRSTLVDLHHDEGYGVETLYGGAKLWVVYPPTEENLSVMASLYGKKKRFMSNHDRFHGGLFIEQKAGETILLPPYCVHLVFTLESSILCGFEIYAAEHFPLRICGLATDLALLEQQQPDVRKRRKDVQEHLGRWHRGLEHALGCEEAVQRRVIMAWVRHEEVVQQHISASSGSATTIHKLWQQYLSKTNIQTCPGCPVHTEGTLATHMERTHLSLLQEDSVQKRQAGEDSGHRARIAKRKATSGV